MYYAQRIAYATHAPCEFRGFRVIAFRREAAARRIGKRPNIPRVFSVKVGTSASLFDSNPECGTFRATFHLRVTSPRLDAEPCRIVDRIQIKDSHLFPLLPYHMMLRCRIHCETSITRTQKIIIFRRRTSYARLSFLVLFPSESLVSSRRVVD